MTRIYWPNNNEYNMNDLRIQFYWDIGSTNSYFAFHLLRPLAASFGATIDYCPFNLGYVFRHHNYVLMKEPAAKLRQRKVDLMRWANKYQLAFRMPDEFPIKTSRALRGALVMRDHGLEERYMEALFKRYWENNDASIQTYEGLASTVEALGINSDRFAQACESEDIRQQSIALTDQALADGVFGAPSMVLAGQLFWGKDRFDFMQDLLLELTSSE